MTRPWAALVLLPGALSSCDPSDRFSAVQLDTSPNCTAAAVEVLAADLDAPQRPWSHLIAAAVDAPGQVAFWALVRTPSQTIDPGPLAMVHLDDEGVDARLELDPLLPDTHEVDLRPGPSPHSAWLTERGPGTFRVWHLNASTPAQPLVGVSDNLGWFPSNLARLCGHGSTLERCDTTHWHRELAFIEGAPYLISTPPFSPNATLFLYAARLRADLGVAEQTQLEFFPRCVGHPAAPANSACAQAIEETRYPTLRVMGAQQDVGSAAHHQFIVRERSRSGSPLPRDLVVLALDLDSASRIRGFVFSYDPQDVAVAAGPPGGLATDDLAAYLLHPVLEGGARVTRLLTQDARTGSTTDRFEVLRGLPLEGETATLQMLQLSGDIAVGRLADGAWEVTKIFPDAPTRSEQTLYTADAPITGVQSAGRGAYLLFQDHDSGPDLVQLRCED